jgi:hypothetical protein
MTLDEALAKLDPEKDEHWTQNGLPRLDVLAAMGSSATRKQVTDANPELTRQSMMEAQTTDDAEDEEDVSEVDEADASSEDEDVEESGNKAALESKIQEITNYINDEHKKMADCKSNIISKEVELTKVQTEYNSLFPGQTNQEDIIDFIKSQNQQRLQRHERNRQAFSNIKISDLDPRAPVDRAMARKTGRGYKRPSRV